MSEERLKNIGYWLINGNTGISSKVMCAYYLGARCDNPRHPLDSSDFNRCAEFAKLLSEDELKQILTELGNKSDVWDKISRNWDTLIGHLERNQGKELYKLLKKYRKTNE